jgi:hypothetical protein
MILKQKETISLAFLPMMQYDMLISLTNTNLSAYRRVGDGTLVGRDLP